MQLLNQLRSFLALLKTAEFSKGISFAVAAIVPLLVTGYLERLEVGIPMTIGVLLSSPSDVPGSLRRRMIGVSLSVLMAVTGTIMAGYAASYQFFSLPVLAVLVFCFSMLSVYGFRASLIAFSGLFAIVLSLAKVNSGGSVIENALLVGAGGVWYLIFTISLHYLTRRQETEALLAEGFALTAKYLDIRNRLLRESTTGREALQRELIQVQTEINEKHELIREILISRRKNSGRSRVVRKNLLIFMEMVDILELAMANPVNYDRMEELFAGRRDALERISSWSEMMAQQVRRVGERWSENKPYVPNADLEEARRRSWEVFKDLEQTVSLPDERQVLLVYRSLLLFKDKQYQKILSIERFMGDRGGKANFRMKTRDAEKFITTQDYNLKNLVDNLDRKSPIFRHSLRLTVVLMAGLVIGKLVDFQNAYWILLTSLVILRPGYALTRERFQQRLYGTLIGGAVAASIVLLVQNPVVYGILAVVTLVLAFSMIQRNYKTAAAFITLNVVFVYGLIKPNAFEVIQFRVLDTIAGAALAFLGNKFLWPTWEYTGIRSFVAGSIQSNQEFIREIKEHYYTKGKLKATYKLARKKAFLAMGDLSAAFQRLAQEPRSGGTDLENVFKLISLNQELLSAAASLGTFIRAHKTTPASPHFTRYMEAIDGNLSFSVAVLEGASLPDNNVSELEKADAYFRQRFQELSELRSQEREAGKTEISLPLRDQFQEIQMISDQLKWLMELSETMRSLVLQHFKQ